VQLQVRAADRDVVAGGLDLRPRARMVGRGLVGEGVGRIAAAGSRGFGVWESRDLEIVSAVVVVVVVAVLEAVVVCAAAAAVDWEGCLWRSMVVAVRNMEIVVVDFAAVVDTDRWDTPVAVVVDVTWNNLVLVAVAMFGYSFACCRLEYPGCLSQVPVPNCSLLHLLQLPASHHT
jgi:hypothetical protein